MMTLAEAHDILNRCRAGEPIPVTLVTLALVRTGDLVPRLRGRPPKPIPELA